MTLLKVNVAHQATLNAAACEFGLHRIGRLRERPELDDPFGEEMDSIHDLVENALNSIVCLTACCDMANHPDMADLFGRIRIDYAGFGFDYSISKSEWSREDRDYTEDDARTLVSKKLSQLELILTAMRDRYLDAAARLERA